MTFSYKAFGLGAVLGLISAVAPSCGSSAAACDATTCGSGCCSNGVCLAGTSPNACGASGLTCNTCSSGQTCTAGTCRASTATTCNATTCATGCCANNVCQSATSAAACGTGGLACRACDTGASCTAGVCVMPGSDAGSVDEQIALARAAALDAGVLPVRIVGATVTYLKPLAPDAGNSDPAGFFLQGSAGGPAVFVSKDPSSVVADGLQVGDTVSLTVTGARRFSGLRNITEVSMVSKGTAVPVTGLVTDATGVDFSQGANVDAFESRLISISGTTATASVAAGGGYRGYQFNTEGTPDAGTSIRFRVPNALADATDLTAGCSVTLTQVPMWRFTNSTTNQAQPSAWAASELSDIRCPSPRVLSAAALSLTEATVLFDRNLDASTINVAAFSINSLSVTAAVLTSPRAVTLTTAAQSPVSYTVTVATTVKDTRGATLDSAANTATFTGGLVVVVDAGVPDAGTGTTDAGTVCDATSCASGCCSNNVCQPGTAADLCGLGGGACSVCSSNQTCSAQVCTTTTVDAGTPFDGGTTIDAGTPVDAGTVCGPTNCSTGCCQGNLCLPGTSTDSCGGGGLACVACGGIQTCDSQVCGPVGIDAGNGLACAPTVVISQFYGGGQSTMPTIKSDYVELHNLTADPVDLSSWSVQYASAGSDGGTGEWRVGALSGTIAPFSFFLVELSTGNDGATLTPAPDFTLSVPISVSATDGRIALVRSTQPLIGCPKDGAMVDLLGYGGSLSCSEGAPAAVLSKTEALVRKDPGACVDSNNNANDFVKAAPAPRSSVTTQSVCYCPNIVISQVYGGGGGNGATFRTDYIELHNRTASAIDLRNWSVQYNSAGAQPTAPWTVGALGGTIGAGGYFLVATSSGGDGGVLPRADYTTTNRLTMSASNGRVALVAGTTAIAGCPTAPAVVDLVGYGTEATCSETAPAATLTSLESLSRTDVNACIDTNDNSFDFTKGAPSPRTSSSPSNVCQ